MVFDQFLWRRVMRWWFQNSPADCSTLRSATDCEDYWTLRCQFLIFLGFVHGVDKLQDWVSHSTTREKVKSSYTRKHSFRGTAPTFARFQSFTFYRLRHLKIIVSSAEIESEEMSPTHFLCLSGNSKQRRVIWKDAAFVDASMHALIQMEEILDICELWLDRQ